MHIITSNQPSLELGFGGYTCNWGAHICGLYETVGERDEIVFGFLNRGDDAGDLQLYIPSERSPEDFRQKYGRLYGTCACHLDDPDRFRILTARDIYYPEGVFSPWKMDEGLNAFFRESQKKGPRNIRGIAEMVWALEAIPGAELLMVYESRLNYFLPSRPWVGICLYNVGKFSGSVIMNVLRTHPYTISRGVITENPFYQTPDEWLRMNAPEYLGTSAVNA